MMRRSSPTRTRPAPSRTPSPYFLPTGAPSNSLPPLPPSQSSARQVGSPTLSSLSQGDLSSNSSTLSTSKLFHVPIIRSSRLSAPENNKSSASSGGNAFLLASASRISKSYILLILTLLTLITLMGFLLANLYMFHRYNQCTIITGYPSSPIVNGLPISPQSFVESNFASNVMPMKTILLKEADAAAVISNSSVVSQANQQSEITDSTLETETIPVSQTKSSSVIAAEDNKEGEFIQFDGPSYTVSDDVAQLLYDAQHTLEPVGNVPKIVHFVHGLGKASPTKPLPFSITNYLAIKSALDVIQADHVYLWMRNIPTDDNKWWNMTMNLGRADALRRNLGVDNTISIHPTRDVTDVFGKEVDHHAHKADVIRLEALLTYGGIYLDMDVVAVKSFDELLDVPCTMGLEGLDGGTHPHGLGNAVIICHRSSPWLHEWYNGYRRFNKAEWASLSVHLPLRMSKAFPHYVHALPEDAFFRPSWNQIGTQELYIQDRYDLSNNYAVHLWGGGSKYRNQESFEQICRLKTTWGRIARIALLAGPGNANICDGFARHR